MPQGVRGTVDPRTRWLEWEARFHAQGIGEGLGLLGRVGDYVRDIVEQGDVVLIGATTENPSFRS